jgi:HlyD family secretion protein
MSKRVWIYLAVLSAVAAVAVYWRVYRFPQGERTPSFPVPTANDTARQPSLICTGMVEAVDGEIEVFAQIPGELAEVRVSEGDEVAQGQILAVIDASRFAAMMAVAEAQAEVARANLKRIEAGSGDEEKDEVLFAAESIEALLGFERIQVERFRTLSETHAVPLHDLQKAQGQLEHLAQQAKSLRQRHAALVRGPLAEELEVAHAEVVLAEARVEETRINYEYRMVRAPSAGTVVKVYRHAGDSVSIEQITPILRMVDSSRLQIRLEIDEADVPLLQPGLEGTFRIRGHQEPVGVLRIGRIVPQFGPKRLFTPDTSVPMDTRTLSVLCEIGDSHLGLYPGQRVTATLFMNSPGRVNPTLSASIEPAAPLPP